MPMNDEHRHEIQPIPETELQRIVRDELERALDEIRRAFSGAGV